jgi:hypothetical protein
MYLDGQGPRDRTGRPPAAALALYRQATDLLQNGILPSAYGLTGQNAAVLDRAYQATRSTAQLGTLVVTLIGVALAAALGACSSTWPCGTGGYSTRPWPRPPPPR